MGLLFLPAPFRKNLLRWFHDCRRDLPWRRDTDFYRVWVSEIMLQQTRVEAVVPYYERFMDAFPTVQSLAEAPEQKILAAWSGLGYYSRARNLQQAARRVAQDGLPVTHAEISDLPGIGPYTAAAVASIVLNLPYAAVDGNVIRVVARLTNDASEISSPAARRGVAETAQQLLDPVRPGDFNQAMMELGATVCKPKTPLCGECPVRPFCAAHAAGTERELPVKLKKQRARDVPLDLMALRRRNFSDQICLLQRDAAESRLAGFWELPGKQLWPGLKSRLAAEFSHRIVNDRFRVRIWSAVSPKEVPHCRWMSPDEYRDLPLTTITRKALAALADAEIRSREVLSGVL